MGKIKRQRKKLHISDNVGNHARETKSFSDVLPSSVPVQMSTGYENSGTSENSNNIFAGIDISLHDLKSLGDDCRSVTSTSKSIFKGLSVKKAERRKLRHQTFIAQLQAIHSLKNQKKKKKFKKSSRGAEQIVPSLTGPHQSIDLKGDYEKAPPKQRGTLKSNSRHKFMLKSVAALQNMWANPAFKADPIGLVSDLVQERVAKEAE